MNKEEIKKFFKLDWKKILVTLIIFVIFSYFSINTIITSNNCGLPTALPYVNYIFGFPLKYVLLCDRNYINLAVDLFFWYFISCTFVYLYGKFKNLKS